MIPITDTDLVCGVHGCLFFSIREKRGGCEETGLNSCSLLLFPELSISLILISCVVYMDVFFFLLRERAGLKFSSHITLLSRIIHITHTDLMCGMHGCPVFSLREKCGGCEMAVWCPKYMDSRARAPTHIKGVTNM